MIKETITYTDYFGEKRTEEFRFNLSKAELTEMETSIAGGYTNLLQKMVDTKNTPEMMKTFKEIVLKSYGEISPDGRRFIKSKEMAEEFCQTEAYSELFMKLIIDTDEMIKFVNGIVPAEISEKMKEENAPKLPSNVVNS